MSFLCKTGSYHAYCCMQATWTHKEEVWYQAGSENVGGTVESILCINLKKSWCTLGRIANSWLRDLLPTYLFICTYVSSVLLLGNQIRNRIIRMNSKAMKSMNINSAMKNIREAAMHQWFYERFVTGRSLQPSDLRHMQHHTHWHVLHTSRAKVPIIFSYAERQDARHFSSVFRLTLNGFKVRR